MPIPSSLDGQLYISAGAAGVAMANLAARMGLETTGLTLPLAKPAADVPLKDVKTKAVVGEDSALGKEVVKKLQSEDTAGPEAQTPLSSGEGELRVIDHAFGKQSAVLVRGDEQGATAALQVLTDRFPNLWETGKQYAALEELRYDLHRFFSLRSGVGQAAVSLYHLNRWIDEINHSSAQFRSRRKSRSLRRSGRPAIRRFRPQASRIPASCEPNRCESRAACMPARNAAPKTLNCISRSPPIHTIRARRHSRKI